MQLLSKIDQAHGYHSHNLNPVIGHLIDGGRGESKKEVIELKKEKKMRIIKELG